MNKKFNLSDSIAHKKHISITNTLDKLITSVQTDAIEMVRVNFEIEKKLRQQLKAKASLEGKQIKEVLIDLVHQYLNNKPSLDE